jgi:hypothetical protein
MKGILLALLLATCADPKPRRIETRDPYDAGAETSVEWVYPVLCCKVAER